MSRDRLHPALSWVCAEDGTPFGGGIFVGPKQVVTCAHVVAAALDIATAGDIIPAPEERVRIRFTHVNDSVGRGAVVRASHWFPPGPGGDADPGAGDIALLDLVDEPPAAAQPLASFSSGARQGDVVHAFGLPLWHGEQSGGWASGELAGPQASGWVQINSPTTGYRIQPGFSGAAAWSDVHDAVVGVIVAAEGSPETRVAWMIPAAYVGELCPEVAVEATATPLAPTARAARVRRAAAGALLHLRGVRNAPPGDSNEYRDEKHLLGEELKRLIEAAGESPGDFGQELRVGLDVHEAVASGGERYVDEYIAKLEHIVLSDS
jgi:Trypsin-like peptidase domain